VTNIPVTRWEQSKCAYGNGDGSKVFFMSDRSGQQNIWMLPKGGQAKQLTAFTDGRVCGRRCRTTAGDRFRAQLSHLEMNTGSGKAAELPITLRGASSSPYERAGRPFGQIGEVALSPDGKKVAIIARGEVFAVHPKTPARRSDHKYPAARVTSFGQPTAEIGVRIRTQRRSQPLQYDFATETETPMTQGQHTDSSPVFSPMESRSSLSGCRSLMVYSMDTKQERELSKIFADRAR